MKLSELIAKLQHYHDTRGDLEVLITDDYRDSGYRGNFDVSPSEYSGERFIEIDVKRCLEE